MKIALGSKIFYSPWGGGNNFAINLFNFLEKKKCKIFFDLNENDLDIILLTDPRSNSLSSTFDHYDINKYLSKNINSIVVHRINECDERKNTIGVNRILLEANCISDHTVFISSWLKNLFEKYKKFENSSVILNGADRKIFYHNSMVFTGKNRFKLVTHHWSNHINKGFDVYKSIDDKLSDTFWKKKIDFTIIGNIPKKMNFVNTNLIAPISGKSLAEAIQNNHAYITASINEPGGNHQNEAINCGLPTLYLDSGCMDEYCRGFGLSYTKSNLFQKIEEMMDKQKKLRKKLLSYKYDSEFTCQEYYKLFKNLLENKKRILNKRRKIKFSIVSRLVSRLYGVLN